MKTFFTILLIPFLLIVTNLHAQDATKTYPVTSKGFSIAYPTTWQVQTESLGLTIAGWGPTTNVNEKTRDSVNVVVDDLPAPMPLQQYYDSSVAVMKEMIAQVSITESTRVTVGGLEAIRMTALQNAKIDIFNKDVKALVYFLVNKNKGYVITCATLPENLETFKPQCESIVGSFKFL